MFTAASSTADIVLFGGFGDLSQRKLLPALFNLFVSDELHSDSRIVLIGRHEYSDDAMREEISAVLAPAARDLWDEYGDGFLKLLAPVTLSLGVDDDRWLNLKNALSTSAERARVYYLALPPSLYNTACDELAAHGLVNEASRLVIEKPIGHDRDSANEIINGIAEHFPEDRVYRIDHYLGKETVQNLLVLRFSNMLFERLWNNQSIEHVQITLAETVGLEGRVSFYDQYGAMRDLVQNHLLQLLALVCMEQPNRMEAHSIRQEKIKVVRSLRPITGRDVFKNVVRGQYSAGVVGRRPVASYADELGKHSTTETFVGIRAKIDNWRWAGVPFYLRTGKRLIERFGEVVVQFRPVPFDIFGGDAGDLQPNRLIIALQPDEGLTMTLMGKVTGRGAVKRRPMTMRLDFQSPSGGSSGYQRLLLDVINAEQSLFVHRDEIEAAWAWIDPIIEAWENSGLAPLPYEAGSWGPKEADYLLSRDNNHWYAPSQTR